MFPDDLIPRATQVLLPRWATPDERSAWLAQAFFLAEPRLYNDLRVLDGQPIIILTNTITALLEAGCLPNKKAHALAQLLTSVRIIAPPEAQAEIDRLVPLLNNACADSTQTNTINAISPIKKPVRPANALQSIETPLAERTPTVFISYSHTDDDFALRLIDDLQGGGHAVWIDKMNIKGGAEWVRSIADGISNSYAFVSILSPDANSSRWVQREYLYADNLGKPIFPVMARPSEVPFQMIDRQVLSLVENYAMGLEQLLTVLPAPRAITITMEMMQPAPQSPPALVDVLADDDERETESSAPPIIMPPLRPSSPITRLPTPAPQAPPMQSGSTVMPPPPPQAKPAPMVISRKSGSATRRLWGMVGVLLVGAIGISVLVTSLSNTGSLQVATPPISMTAGVVATQTGETPAADFSANNGLLTLLSVIILGAGVVLTYSLLAMRRAQVSGRVPTFGGGVPEGTAVGGLPAPEPAPIRRQEQAKEAEEAGRDIFIPSLDDFRAPPKPAVKLDEEYPASASTAVDRRALELMYINRVTAQRIDAMVDMKQPSSDDRVRVMTMGMGGLSVSESAWAGVEALSPDKGGLSALNVRRAILMGDDRQDSMTAMWAAAGALMHVAASDPTRPLPLVIDVSTWPDGLSLKAFIQHEMGELGDYLETLLKDKRVAFLFDGLYRLTPARLAQVEAFLVAHPDVSVIVDMTLAE